MNYRELIKAARQQLEYKPGYVTGISTGNIFSVGGEWMGQWLNELRGGSAEKVTSIPYAAYGKLKYAISLVAFIASAMLLGYISYWLLPLAIVIFYLVEIHFLFLFPLLIDEVENPVGESMKLTYQMGIYKTLITVMPIGFYMVVGLMNFKNPFKNWHIGCLAVLIWYEHETGNRIQS